MRIDSSNSSQIQGGTLSKTVWEQGKTISIKDTFQPSGAGKDPGIIDMKKAAEMVTTDKQEKYNVLWTYRPEPKQLIREDSPLLRETYEKLGGTFLRDYLDSLGKPYLAEAKVSGDPIFSQDGHILLATNLGDIFSVSTDGKPQHIKEVPLERYTNVDKMQQSPTGDIFFTAGRDLHRLDPKTGELWKFQSLKGRPGSYYSIGKSGTIYQGTWNKREPNSLYALNPNDTVKWEFPMEGKAIRGNAVEGTDGRVHMNTYGGDYIVLSPKGEKLVEISLGKDEYTATWQPVLSADGKKMFMGSKGGCVVCLSTEDGKQIWKKSLGPDNVEHIALDGRGNVYAARSEGTLVMMDSDGNEKWSVNCGGALMTPPTFSEQGDIYQVSGDGSLHCFNGKGTPLWKAKMTDNYAPTPLVDKEGTLYIKTESGSLQAVKNKTIREMIDKANESGKNNDGVPTIEIGEGFVTIGGVKVKVNKK